MEQAQYIQRKIAIEDREELTKLPFDLTKTYYSLKPDSSYIDNKIVCPACGGSGRWVWANKRNRLCPHCDGSKTIRLDSRYIPVVVCEHKIDAVEMTANITEKFIATAYSLRFVPNIHTKELYPSKIWTTRDEAELAAQNWNNRAYGVISAMKKAYEDETPEVSTTKKVDEENKEIIVVPGLWKLELD